LIPAVLTDRIQGCGSAWRAFHRCGTVDEQSDEPKRRIACFLKSTFFSRRWVIGGVELNRSAQEFGWTLLEWLTLIVVVRVDG
jgi:hypothetical protein